MLSIIVLLALCGLAYVWDLVHGMTLAHPSLVSGWGLVTLMAFLTLYNLRKKLSFLPLTASNTWMLMHLYAGGLTVFLFALHINLTRQP